jgi:putative chitinase
MNTLRLDSKGPDVKRVQQRLADLGFSPGAIDGAFGVGTEAAVMAFQRSKGLLADGVVGPNTAEVLFEGVKRAPTVAATDILDDVTPQMAARMFPQTNLTAIKNNLPPVLQGLRDENLTDKPMVLMALATIRAETEGFVPIDEGISRFNTSPGGAPFDLYDFRADLGNGAKGDGAAFKGRGYIQLTGKANYRTIGKSIGQPLEAQPNLANDPAVAGRILASFLAK